MTVYGLTRYKIGVDEFPFTMQIQYPINGVYHDRYYAHDSALKVTLMMMIKFVDIVKTLPADHYITEYSSMDSKKLGKFLTIEEFKEIVKDVVYVEEPPWLKCPCDSCRG